MGFSEIKRTVLLTCISLAVFVLPVSYANKKLRPLTSINVGLLQPFAIQNSQGSQKLINAFNATVFYSVGRYEKKLNSCGYNLQIVPAFFLNSELTSIVKASKSLLGTGVWITLGPERSTQVLVAQNILSKKSAFVSTEAGAERLSHLKKPFFAMTNGQTLLAEAAYHTIRQSGWGKNYGVFVDATCLDCKDFVSAFKKYANKDLNLKFVIKGAGEPPALSELQKKLKSSKIDFLLIPDPSKFSGYTMSKIHKLYPTLKFLGNDDWGQSEWSFLPGFNLPSSIDALAIRQGIPADELTKAYQVYSLNQYWDGNSHLLPLESFYVLHFFDILSKTLCYSKAKTRNEYYQYLASQPKTLFRITLPISVYKLMDGQLKFVSVYQKTSGPNDG